MCLKPLLRCLKTKKPALPRWKTTSVKSSKLYFKRFTRPKPGPKLPGTPLQQPPQQPPHKVPPILRPRYPGSSKSKQKYVENVHSINSHSLR